MNDLRDGEAFQWLTDGGRCWKCGGVVVAYFADETYARESPWACYVRISPGGFRRDCITDPVWCGWTNEAVPG